MLYEVITNAIGGLIKSSNNKNAANLLGEEIEANRQINVPISEVGLQIFMMLLAVSTAIIRGINPVLLFMK